MRSYRSHILLCALAIVWSLAAAALPRFNEIMAANDFTINDGDGDASDWIEMYNAGPPASLLGYGLSDDAARPFKWVFPAVTIQSNQFLIVWASGKNRTNPGSPLHTDFKISTEGEELLLTEPSGVRQDSVPPAALLPDISFGRKPDGTGTWCFFDRPTPGAANTATGYVEALAPPDFSSVGGLYTNAFYLTLSNASPSAIIYYTVDGSPPTEQSPVFSNDAPLYVKSRQGQTNVFSLIQTSPYWKQPTAEVFKATVVRARVFKPQCISSPIVTHTFFVDSKMMTRYSMPIISIVTARTNFFDYYYGIYVPGMYYTGDAMWSGNYFQDGRAWERPIHLEWYETNGACALSLDAGTRINGALTRNIPVKALRIYVRDDYGTSWIKDKVFSDSSATKFKRLLLRTGGNDYDKSFLTDVFAEKAAHHVRADTRSYRPVIVFVDGEYWGVHNLCERFDKYYLQTKYGFTDAQTEQFDIIKGVGNGWALQGDMAHYNAMLWYIDTDVRTHAFVLTTNAYAYVKTQMDVDNFIDAQAVEIYSCNYDWPGNNMQYWRLRTNSNATATCGHDGRWRWFLYDLDTTFGGGWNATYTATYDSIQFATYYDTNDVYKGVAPMSSPSLPGPYGRGTFLFRALLTCAEFKYEFINRMADHMNTTYKRERLLALANDIQTMYAPEMTNHILRWSQPSSISYWSSRMQRIRDFAGNRSLYMRTFITNYFGLSGTAQVTLNVDNSAAGRIAINSLLLDTNTPGVIGAAYPWTGIYFRGVPVSITAVPGPLHRFVQWAGGGTSSNLVMSLSTNIELTALFEPYTNAPVIMPDALVYPASNSILHVGTPANIVWSPAKIVDEAAGLDSLVTIYVVSTGSYAVRTVVATNVPNTQGSCTWSPDPALESFSPYCMRFDAQCNGGPVGTRVFTGKRFYVVPEGSVALVGGMVFVASVRRRHSS